MKRFKTLLVLGALLASTQAYATTYYYFCDNNWYGTIVVNDGNQGTVGVFQSHDCGQC